VADVSLNDDVLVSNLRALQAEYRDGTRMIDVCPVCESSDISVFHPNIHRATHPNFYIAEDNLVWCDHCGTIMTDRIFPPDYYFRYLNEFYDVNPPGIYPESYIRPLIRKKYLEDTLLKYADKPRSILEVSSFEGTTLDTLSDFGCEVFGVEPTTSAHVLAVKSFPRFSHRLVNRVFEDCAGDLQDETFDLIIFSQSFRQIADPIKSLQIVDDLISEGGFLLIDEGSFLEHMLTCPFSELPYNLFTEKNYYYSQTGLLHLLHRFGFEYLCHTQSHAVQGVGATRRYAMILLRKKSDLEIDDSLLQQSKKVSNILVSAFRERWSTPEDVLQQILDTQVTAG